MTLQRLLGVELPIIQAPMAGVQGSALAVAVSNAGGLGSLPCAMLSIDGIRSELAAIAAQTAKPFNVNFFCHVPPTPSAAREAAWRGEVSSARNELSASISPSTTEASHGWAEMLPSALSGMALFVLWMSCKWLPA